MAKVIVNEIKLGFHKISALFTTTIGDLIWQVETLIFHEQEYTHGIRTTEKNFTNSIFPFGVETYVCYSRNVKVCFWGPGVPVDMESSSSA
jgi:hypothetical protein